jgi:hypothetical protein
MKSQKASDTSQIISPLHHHRICVHCGSASEADDSKKGVTAGLFVCPACGRESPPNPQMRGLSELELKIWSAARKASQQGEG